MKWPICVGRLALGDFFTLSSPDGASRSHSQFAELCNYRRKLIFVRSDLVNYSNASSSGFCFFLHFLFGHTAVSRFLSRSGWQKKRNDAEMGVTTTTDGEKNGRNRDKRKNVTLEYSFFGYGRSRVELDNVFVMVCTIRHTTYNI